MTNAEFLDYIKKAQNGEEEARTYLVNNNIALVWSIVHRFKHTFYDKEDIFQIGCVGLVKAINKFDTSYNVSFSTYAVPIILGEIKRYFRDDGAIKVSRSLKELNQKINQLSEFHQSTSDKPMQVEELAECLNVSTSDIIMAIDSRYYPTSLQETIYEKDGSSITVEDRLAEEENFNIIDKITLQEELKKLDSREQLLIKLRYYKDMNQEEIAKIFNVSQVQISRMEKKIIEKLKKQFI